MPSHRPNEARGEVVRPIYLTGTALGVIAVGILHLVVLSLLVFLPMFHQFLHSSPLVPAYIGIAVCVPLALVAAGIGIVRGATWSRPLAMLGLLVLIVKAAYHVWKGHMPASGYGWAELGIYTSMSLLLISRRASAFFIDRRGRG